MQTVAALARSQHPAAVQAVLDMVRDPNTHGQLRFQATISASMDVRDVPESLVDDLIRFGKDGSEYKGMAQLATAQLGTLYDLRRGDRPELAEKALQALQNRLATDSGDGLQAALMGAGNSKTARLYDAIVPHLSADDDTIEAQAWTALGGQPLPSLLEHFDDLLALADSDARKAALFEAIGNALEAGQAPVPPQVLAVALQLYGAEDHALRPVADLALLKVLAQAWRTTPGDPQLLAALRAKFQAAQAGHHADEIKSILAVVGIDQLVPGGAG